MNRIKSKRQWTARERNELRKMRRQNVDYATLAKHTAVSQKRERLGIAPGNPEHGPRRRAA